MPIQHHSQIRARNVLEAQRLLGRVQGREGGGNVIKGIPEKIVNHGLLAAAADAVGQDGATRVWGAIACHLGDPLIGLIDPDVRTLSDLLDFLTSPDFSSRRLRLVTAETMEWLNFARRLI